MGREIFNEHSVAAELKTGHFLGSAHCCVGDLVSFCFILCTQCGLDTEMVFNEHSVAAVEHGFILGEKLPLGAAVEHCFTLCAK